MSLFRTASLFAVAALTLGWFALPLSAQQPVTRPSQNAASSVAVKLKQPGLPNFGRVNQRLYRGGQPEPEGFDALHKLGIDMVVNFNTSEEAIREERAEVESRGMRYVSIPWSARSLPRREQVTKFFRLLRENPDAEIFVHCRRGADRTGVMLAAYRMAIDGWTPEQALTEMERFKFHGLWYRHLKRYVREFPALLESDPGLISGAAPPIR